MRLNLLANLLYDEVLFSLILALGGLIVGKIVYTIFHKYMAKFAAKTKTTLDDKIVESLETPLYVIIIFIGLFFGILNISALDAYATITKGVFWVVFSFCAVFVVKKLTNSIVDWYSEEISHKTKSKVDDKIFPLLRKLLNIFLYVIFFMMILDHFNIEISPLIASLGVASLAVALALQDTLSNFFSGMYIMADRPVKIGDFIQFDSSESGYVEHIGWRSSRIRKLSNNLVIIPNSTLANATIINYDMPHQPLSIITYCGVSYDSDLEKVEKVAYKAALDTRDQFEQAFKDYDPLIRYYEFGDSNINFKIILRANKYVDKFKLQHELIKKIKSAFDKENIEISWPVRKVFYGDKQN